MALDEDNLMNMQEYRANDDKGQLVNEAIRLIFNMEIGIKHLRKIIEINEEKGLKMRRNIRALIEDGRQVDAQLATEELIQTSQYIMWTNVVVKKMEYVWKYLSENVKDSDIISTSLVTYMRKVEKAMRAKDVQLLDTALSKIKKYLHPDQVDESTSIRSIIDSSKELEKSRIYDEIYDEVKLISSLAGNKIQELGEIVNVVTKGKPRRR